MTTELTAVQSLWLSRLRRCPRWAESGRDVHNIHLEGIRRGEIETQSAPLDVLIYFLKTGIVECKISPRIEEPDYTLTGRRERREVMVKYWTVLDDAERQTTTSGD